MPLQRFLPRGNHKVLASLLVLALLLAQWSGFNHRIIHAGVQGINAASDSENFRDAAHHSCVAFDAAALAATIHSALFAVPPLPNVHALVLWLAPASWRAPFSPHFLSRAPPAA